MMYFSRFGCQFDISEKRVGCVKDIMLQCDSFVFKCELNVEVTIGVRGTYGNLYVYPGQISLRKKQKDCPRLILSQAGAHQGIPHEAS